MDFDAKKEMKLNLIYFIYFNGRLGYYHKLNLQLLNAYWPVFNGQKIIKIAVDGNYPLKSIIDLLPKDCDYQVVKNNKALGEAGHFLDFLKKIKGGYTFYAHCKGVSRPIMKGLDIWIKHLYKANLQNVPDLGDNLFSGTCGKLLKCPPYVPEPFHYSGSFYWMNSDKIKIPVLDVNKYLTERFPGMVADEKDCLFIQPSSNLNLCYYNLPTWHKL